MEDCGGVFPDSYEGLRKLAGIGDYTAGAILSIAFGQAVPAVDGNVLRVAARLTGDGAMCWSQRCGLRTGRPWRTSCPTTGPETSTRP